MEVNSFFITEDLFDLIFITLSYEEKINFSQITSFTYNTYYHRIRFTIHKSPWTEKVNRMCAICSEDDGGSICTIVNKLLTLNTIK